MIRHAAVAQWPARRDFHTRDHRTTASGTSRAQDARQPVNPQSARSVRAMEKAYRPRAARQARRGDDHPALATLAAECWSIASVASGRLIGLVVLPIPWLPDDHRLAGGCAYPLILCR